MRPKEFEAYLARDLACYHCGRSGQDLVPQHRAGRGMGGSKARHRPANIIVFCSYANGLIESDAAAASAAREHGWKLAGWQIPEEVPVYEHWSGLWWILDNDGGRRPYESNQTL